MSTVASFQKKIQFECIPYGCSYYAAALERLQRRKQATEIVTLTDN